MMYYSGISSLYWQCWNCGEYNHPMIEGQCRHCNAPEHPSLWQFIKSLVVGESSFKHGKEVNTINFWCRNGLHKYKLFALGTIRECQRPDCSKMQEFIMGDYWQDLTVINDGVKTK